MKTDDTLPKTDSVDDTKRGFHWRDNWYWNRTSDGDARVTWWSPNGETVLADIVIPEAEWASIVCSISAGSETGERWDAARRFHGNPS